MSFLKKLFGSSNSSSKKSHCVAVSHEGYEIIADPQSEGQQFRVSGIIIKEFDGILKEHILIRADLFPSKEEAAEATIRKAKHLITEQGDRIFP